MSATHLQVRRATAADLPELSRFGAALAQLHRTFDGARFTAPEPAEPAFAAFFADELANPDAVLLIAEADKRAVGYAFVRMEEASLVELRGPGAWLHDIYVEPAARGQGAGRSLVAAAIEAARALGSDSLMLAVSPHNAAGRRLFGEMGLRVTMHEMRVELL